MRRLIGAVLVTAMVSTIATPNRAAAVGADWNMWTEKGRVVAVYQERDSSAVLVESRVTILTGNELITFNCLVSDADCDFMLLDTCGSKDVVVGAIDFIDHTFAREICTSGYGKCLYAKGALSTASGELVANSDTTTVLAISDCSPR